MNNLILKHFVLVCVLTSAAWAEDVTLPLKTLSGHPGGVYSVAFSSDSRILATAGQGGTINLWDTSDFHSMRTWKDHSASVNSIFYSAGGKFLVSGSDDGSVLVRSATDYSIMERISLSGKVSSLVQSQNRKISAAVLDEKKIQFLMGPSFSLGKSLDGGAAAFSPDNRFVAVAGLDSIIRILNPAFLGVTSTLKGHKGAVLALAFSRDGSMLASGGADQTVKIWDTRNMGLLKTLRVPDYSVTALAFSPDGRFLAYGGILTKDDTLYRYNDSEFFVWDLVRGKKTASIAGHRGSVLSLVFSPDKKWLVSGSADKTVRVWDAKAWAPKPKSPGSKAAGR